MQSQCTITLQSCFQDRLCCHSAHRAIDRSTFGEYIRKARLGKGPRQVDVAKAIGVDEMTTVSLGEIRDHAVPGQATVAKLCELPGLDSRGAWNLVPPFIGPDDLVPATLKQLLNQKLATEGEGSSEGRLATCRHRWNHL